MTHPPGHRQPDLFATDDPPMMLTRAEMGRLVPVSALLMEAVADRLAKEGDREDHA